MAEVRIKYHSDLNEAKIAIAWRIATKADKDGHLVLGKCVKASELQREFAEYDFVIVLNKEVWDNPDFDTEKKMALLDHELCHAAPQLDKYFDTMRDERGRQIFRTRKHDIEEFRSVVAHFGCYKRDLESFAETLLKSSAPLFEQQQKRNGKAKAVTQ
jgi:hypothetical protein